MALTAFQQKLSAAFLGAASIMVPMNAANADTTPVTATKTEQTVTPSTLEKDSNGILWFKEGTDGQKASGAAGRLSGEKDAIVIYVMTSKALEGKAIKRAKIMQEWLEKHPKVSTDVPIVAKYIDKGAGYVFLQNGIWDTGHALSKKGVFSPSNAPKALNDVVAGYLASLYNEEKREAGEPVAATTLER